MKMMINLLALGLATSATVVLAGEVEQLKRYSDGLAAPAPSATGHAAASAVVGRAPDSGRQVQVQDLGGLLRNTDRAEVQEFSLGAEFDQELDATHRNEVDGLGIRDVDFASY